jgi:hypothetical protein
LNRPSCRGLGERLRQRGKQFDESTEEYFHVIAAVDDGNLISRPRVSAQQRCRALGLSGRALAKPEAF